MKIHHLRNATCVIEASGRHILVDPMLGAKGTLPPFSYLRFKRLNNPLVDLPENAIDVLSRVTDCLITHSQKCNIRALQHTDHMDRAGERFLKERNTPVTTLAQDANALKTYGLNIRTALNFWEPHKFLNGEITAVPARHGHGLLHHLMANGAGYFIRLPHAPSVYISGDTVYTPNVERALTRLEPDISILAAGTATLDVGRPILMSVNEIMAFIRKAPGTVVLNHLEALNHCPTTRTQIKQELQKRGLQHKAIIPEDGEIMRFG